MDKVLVWQRYSGQYASETPMVEGRDYFMDELLKNYAGNAPGTSGIWIGWHAFKHHTGSRQRQRTVHNIRMPRDPSNIRHAPVDVGRMNILKIL